MTRDNVNVLTVYKFSSGEIDGTAGLRDALLELSSVVETETREEHIPAATDLWGEAAEILLSDSVAAIAAAAAIGDLLWKIIKILKSAGKRISVHKAAIPYLVPAKLRADGDADDESLPRAKVWGPMVVHLDEGSLLGGHQCTLDAEGNEGYLIAVAMPKEPRRVRTRWMIMSSDGEILLSWVTQTLVERVPEFLRPSVG